MRKDGTNFWATAVVDPIRNDNGEIVAFATITRDITERVETQRILREIGAARLVPPHGGGGSAQWRHRP